MKKLFAGVAAAALALSCMSITAFADPDNTETMLPGKLGDLSSTQDFEIPVTIDVTPSGDPATVYQVDIEWNDFDFAYKYAEGAAAKWSPDDHAFSGGATKGSWTEEGSETATITVKNHSNAGIKVSTEYVKDNEESAVEITVTSNDEVELESAVGTAVEAAPSADIKIKISGRPDNAALEGVQIGKMVLTIDKGTA